MPQFSTGATGVESIANGGGGRIPEAEQHRTYELLKGVPGLDRADARDLARIAPYRAFEEALAALDGQRVRNVGGWLRRAVGEGWKPK